MGNTGQVLAVAALGSILGLLVVGFVVSLASGVVSLSSRQGVQLFFVNLSQVMIRVLAYLAGFAAVQKLVGFPIAHLW